MSIKRTLAFFTVLALSTCMFSSLAIAGGAEEYKPTYSGVYIEGNLGYAIHDWRPTQIVVSPFANNRVANGAGGFIFGFDMGYQFNQYFSLEGGWYYYPTVRGAILQRAGLTAEVHTWFAYLGGKFTMPVWRNTYVYGKLLAAYYNSRSNRLLPTTASIQAVGRVAAGVGIPTSTNGSSTWFNPLFAAGIQYYFNENFSINVQYMYAPPFDKRSSSRYGVPESHIFTLGIGYKFVI